MGMKDNATIEMLTELLDRKESATAVEWVHAVEEAISEIERLEQTVGVLARIKPERRVWFHGEHPTTCIEPNERSPEDKLLDEFAAMGDSQGKEQDGTSIS